MSNLTIDDEIDQLRNDMRELAATATRRRLTEDEHDNWRDIIRSLNRKVTQRDGLDAA